MTNTRYYRRVISFQGRTDQCVGIVGTTSCAYVQVVTSGHIRILFISLSGSSQRWAEITKNLKTGQVRLKTGRFTNWRSFMNSLKKNLKNSFDEKLYEECDEPQRKEQNLTMCYPKDDKRKNPVLRVVDFGQEGPD